MFFLCLTAHRLDIDSLELLRTGTVTDIRISNISSLVVTQSVQQKKIAPLIQVTKVSVSAYILCVKFHNVFQWKFTFSLIRVTTETNNTNFKRVFKILPPFLKWCSNFVASAETTNPWWDVPWAISHSSQLSRRFICYSDCLRFGRPRGRSSSPGRIKYFLFSTSSKMALGPTQPPIQ
jgi:hypothetical protein